MTYTPTHTAEGRKLTRAERKAANKAKFAAEQASKPKRKAGTPKASKPTRAERKAANKAAWAKKRKHTSPKEMAKKAGQGGKSSNDRMEARAQRESLRKAEARAAKDLASRTEVVEAADGTRSEVVSAPEAYTPRAVESAGKIPAGLTIVEAANLAKAHWLAEQEALVEAALAEEGQHEMAF